MEPAEIMKALHHNRGPFPREAVKAAISSREAMTPLLLEVLEDARRDPQRLLETPDYMAHIYAMYLLAQLREPRAYPLIVDFFSTPGDAASQSTGDVVTEGLKHILASVACGDPSHMQRLVEAREADEYARGAALRGLLCQVAVGELERDVVIDYLRELYKERLELEPSHVWDTWASCCTDLRAIELEDEVRATFEEGLVAPFWMDFEDFEEALATAGDIRADLLMRGYRLTTDTVDEMEWWACFEPKRSRTGALPGSRSEALPGSYVTGSKASNQSAREAKRKAKAKRKMADASRRKNRK